MGRDLLLLFYFFKEVEGEEERERKERGISDGRQAERLRKIASRERESKKSQTKYKAVGLV